MIFLVYFLGSLIKPKVTVQLPDCGIEVEFDKNFVQTVGQSSSSDDRRSGVMQFEKTPSKITLFNDENIDVLGSDFFAIECFQPTNDPAIPESWMLTQYESYLTNQIKKFSKKYSTFYIDAGSTFSQYEHKFKYQNQIFYVYEMFEEQTMGNVSMANIYGVKIRPIKEAHQ